MSIYRQRGVAAECLSLQERFGVNVNLLLLCVYAGSEFGALLSCEDIAGAERVIGQWHTQVVTGLREVRRLLKRFGARRQWPHAHVAGSLRTQVGDLELESERIESAILAQWCEARLRDWPRGTPDVAVAANCRNVLSHYGAATRRAAPRKLIRVALIRPTR